MNNHDEGATPTAGAPAPQLSARLESAFELAARELLRERRSERRWRIFFRLVWLALALAVAWALLSQRMSMTAPAGPHTALVDIRGELDSEADANAESLVAALTSAFEDASALEDKRASLPGDPSGDSLQADEGRRAVAAVHHQVLDRSFAFDLAGQGLADCRTSELWQVLSLAIGLFLPVLDGESSICAVFRVHGLRPGPLLSTALQLRPNRSQYPTCAQ